MFKNRKLLGILLSIVIVLTFSVGGYASYYKYTQESGANFYVGTGDKSDALEDTNQVRQILDDLGNLLGHSKRNDLYPKDGTTGGSLSTFNNYYLKTAIDTQGEVETIWGVTLMNNLVDDTTPEYGGAMDHNNERDTEVKTVEFNGLYDNGNSGATPTINWQNGNYQKIAVSENTLFTFSNAFIGTITLVINYSGAFTAGFNAGYTILEEGGTEISFTGTNGAVDILKVMYLGTANNYVVGLMANVKD